ncbi:hypothetical protein EIN_152270, partial [Entamoeba invadens IP1]
MSRLEMVYLMQISLYLPTMKDVLTFIQISHNAQMAISSLKVNPWFTTKEDIEEFCTIYSPDTVNCNTFMIRSDVLKKATFVRNYVIPPSPRDGIPFCEKFTTLSLLPSFAPNPAHGDFSRAFECVITSVPSVKLELSTLVYLLDFYETKITDKQHIPFIKKVFLYFSENNIGFNIFLNKHGNLQLHELIEILRKEYSCDITIDWTHAKQYLSSAKFTPKSKNYSNVIDLNFLDDITPICVKGELAFMTEGLKNERGNEKIAQTLEMCHATIVKLIGSSCDLTTLVLPECVNTLLLIADRSQMNDLRNEFQPIILPKNLHVNKLHAKNLTIECKNTNETVKYIELQNAGILNNTKDMKNKRKWEDQNDFPFVNVEKLKISFLPLKCSLEKLKHLKFLNLKSLTKSAVFVNKNAAQNLQIEYLNNCKFLIDAEEKKDFFFEDCESLNLVFLNDKTLDLKLSKCVNPKITITNEIHSLVLDNCTNVELQQNAIIEKLVVLKSNFVEFSQIRAKKVCLASISEFVPIDFEQTETVLLSNVNNFSFENIFKNCTTLDVENCDSCTFIFDSDKLERITVISSKNLKFAGNYSKLEICEVSTDSKIDFPNTEKMTVLAVPKDQQKVETLKIEEFNRVWNAKLKTIKLKNNEGCFFDSGSGVDLKFNQRTYQKIDIIKRDILFSNYISQENTFIRFVPKIESLDVLKIENYVGYMPNFWGVIVGTFIVENYIGEKPYNKIIYPIISASHLVLTNCKLIDFIFDRTMKSMTISDSTGMCCDYKTTGKMDKVIFKNSSFSFQNFEQRDFGSKDIEELVIENSVVGS